MRYFTLLFFVMLPIAANAEPVTKIISDTSGCPINYPFKEEDSLKVVVEDRGKILASKSFCSSYGKATAKIEKDAKGDYFLLLLYGVGRGTNARSEYLSVYKVNANLIEHCTIPISSGAGPQSVWLYNYQISKPLSGGLIFNMTLDVDKDAIWFPADKKRQIEVK